MIKILTQKKLLTAILFLALALRLVGLVPNVAHPDEPHVQIQSQNLVKNIWTSGDFNPHSFKYGSLVFYLQAAVYFPIIAVGYLFEVANTLVSSQFTSPSLDFNLFFENAVFRFGGLLLFVGRAETALFGGASVLVAFLIGKNLFNYKVGMLSALLLAVSPVHVRDSHYITTDIMSSFFILLSLLFLIYLLKSKKWKWFILGGLILGLSATIRYFPVAFLIYPVVLLYSFQRTKVWFFKVLVSILFIFLGIFLGLPFLFLDPQGPAFFLKDMERYVLPWYSTSLSSYFFSFFSTLVNEGKTTIPAIETLYSAPSAFRPIHASWIFFNGFSPLPTIAGLAGMIYILFKSFKKFILLSLIPIVIFIYISSYIPSTYERLIIPILPFFAIFAAVFIDWLFPFLKRFWGKDKAVIIVVVFVGLIIFLPLLKSISASLACNQENIQTQSAQWVRNNISPQAKIGYVTMVSVPSDITYAGYYPLEPDRDLSMEEARQLDLDHAFINAARIDYVTYSYFNDFFIPPAKLFENSYYSLVLSEYHSRGGLLNKIVKPLLCDNSRLYYYKLPDSEKEQLININNFNFDSFENLKFWNVDDYGQTPLKSKLHFNPDSGKIKKGSLEFKQQSIRYTPPRIYSREIPITEGEKYTFSAWVKSGSLPTTDKEKLFLRMDFYHPKSNQPSKELQKITGKIKQTMLLLWDGPTPGYFEKKREMLSIYDDPGLPGKMVALSPRALLDQNWQKLSISTKAPPNTSYVVLSVQSSDNNNATFLVDDISFTGSK